MAALFCFMSLVSQWLTNSSHSGTFLISEAPEQLAIHDMIFSPKSLPILSETLRNHKFYTEFSYDTKLLLLCGVFEVKRNRRRLDSANYQQTRGDSDRSRQSNTQWVSVGVKLSIYQKTRAFNCCCRCFTFCWRWIQSVYLSERLAKVLL